MLTALTVGGREEDLADHLRELIGEGGEMDFEDFARLPTPQGIRDSLFARPGRGHTPRGVWGHGGTREQTMAEVDDLGAVAERMSIQGEVPLRSGRSLGPSGPHAAGPLDGLIEYKRSVNELDAILGNMFGRPSYPPRPLLFAMPSAEGMSMGPLSPGLSVPPHLRGRPSDMQPDPSFDDQVRRGTWGPDPVGEARGRARPGLSLAFSTPSARLRLLPRRAASTSAPCRHR